jgi:membrane protein YqaA with SNARE-associated domain
VTDFLANHGLLSLFLSAFISSTILPGGSEVALVYLANNSLHSDLLLLTVATAGNTLGGATSWLIGYWIAVKFPTRTLQQAKYQKALARIQQWGSPVLLLSWLPVVGDPLCVVAGWLKIPLLLALLFIAVGKCARYYVILLGLG